MTKTSRQGRTTKAQRSAPVFKDPYLPRGGSRELVRCRTCRAIYHHKRWYLEGDAFSSKVRKSPVRLTVCPACRKIRDRFPGGIITLQGGFLKAHKDQILHLVRNQETRAKGINPLERIISIKDRRDRVEIQTTNERLAQRIGREIQRAYKGDAAYHWSRDDKFVRVDWHRNTSPG
jgi:NMD protein affecting ribosome stability and mRNA decay